MTITRIMDICSVFAVDNLKILQRTIGQLFKLQPAFLDDLKTDAEIVIQVLSHYMLLCRWKKQMLSLQLLEKAASEAERAAANQSRQRVFHMKTTELDMQSIVELCAYIIDVAGSLTVLVVVLPESLRVFHQVGLTAECVSTPPFLPRNDCLTDCLRSPSDCAFPWRPNSFFALPKADSK